MSFILFGLLILAAAGAFFIFKKPASSRQPLVQQTSVPTHIKQANPKPAPVNQPSQAITNTPLPEVLGHFHLVRLAELPKEQTDAIVARLRQIPRPPRSLHKLVSAEFLSDATSAELSELMMGEPQIAAKVLATVNSPFYGLAKPLGSIGHAATFLGMTTVRSICLQYMLNDSLKASSPEIKKVFDRLWNASAFASELCFKLAQLLGLPDPGSLVTQVVLSYLGQLATYALLQPETVMAIAQQSFLDKTQAEQAQLGLSSAEIGSLLMQEWGLPPSIIDDVRGIDLILVTPINQTMAKRGARMALCYLCARLGEKLASGDVSDLKAFNLKAQEGPEFHHFLSYLNEPTIARLDEFLHFPEVVSSINQMVSAMQTRR